MWAQLACDLADLFLPPVLVTEWSGLSAAAVSTTCGLPRLIRTKPSTIVEAPTAHFALRSSPKQSHPMTACMTMRGIRVTVTGDGCETTGEEGGRSC